jgi:putative ubiquitin-RnfH superfamily antitoxin RatB of RatAB toxin-antitoxin module
VPAEPGAIAVRIAWSGAPGHAEERVLRLPAGATIADAIDAWRRETGSTMAAEQVGVWGRQQPPATLLADGDRVEIYRPLLIDPMEARRLRQRRQRAARVTGSPRR